MIELLVVLFLTVFQQEEKWIERWSDCKSEIYINNKKLVFEKNGELVSAVKFNIVSNEVVIEIRTEFSTYRDSIDFEDYKVLRIDVNKKSSYIRIYNMDEKTITW